MQEILFEYEMHPTTWVYVSSLMTIGIYFKFRRFWSVRNLDLIGLIAFSPSLLLISHDFYQAGYLWLFAISGVFLIRMLVDSVMVRRPLLEPNLSASGLAFTGVALLGFLMTSVVTGKVVGGDKFLVQPALQEAHAIAASETDASAEKKQPADETPPVAAADTVPGYPPFYGFAGFANEQLGPVDRDDPARSHRILVHVVAARTVAILAHLALVAGMVLVGYRHFDNFETGMAAATLYLLLPYTAQLTDQVDHVVPGALLAWAVYSYRRPLIAGALIGLAGSLIFYPFFLLPLWCGFYWRRGLIRFAVGTVVVVLVMVLLLLIGGSTHFFDYAKQMFGVNCVLMPTPTGFWAFHEPAFRIPVIAGFVALCGSMALWPAQKNLGTLLSCSAAVMLGSQFWHPYNGGIYMAWYLPLLLMTVFRPNLEDRVALSALPEVWYHLRRPRLGRVQRAS